MKYVFPVGAKVILQSLNSAGYNGKEATVMTELTENGRFGVKLMDTQKTILVLPCKIITKAGVSHKFLFEGHGLRIPCKAVLFVYAFYAEVGCQIQYSDHLGSAMLEGAAKKFFALEEDFGQITGQVFGQLATALRHYRVTPGEIVIAMYNHEELANSMIEQGLLTDTGKRVRQGYGEFGIFKINFQKMFYHD